MPLGFDAESVADYMSDDEKARMLAAVGRVNIKIEMADLGLTMTIEGHEALTLNVSKLQMVMYGRTGMIEAEIGSRIMHATAKAMTDAAGIDGTAILKRMKEARKARKAAALENKDAKVKGIFDGIMDDPKGDEPTNEQGI